MTVFVDSDILIEVSRGKNLDIEHTALSNLFRTLTCVPVTAEIGHRAGLYLARFRKSHGVELADALIAAGAVASSANLWTRNKKHYPMRNLSFFD